MLFRSLERHLTQRGYAPGKETLVMTYQMAQTQFAGPVLVMDQIDPAFAKVMADTAASPGDEAERLAALSRVAQPRLFARLDQDGQAAAIGACAVERPWVGIFGMRTHPDFRRRGLARQIVQALLSAASNKGATAAYLQVEAKNTGAIALYQAFGFATAYR